MGKQPEKCPGNRQKPAKQDKEINDQHPLYSPIPRVSKETTTRKTKTKNKNKKQRGTLFSFSKFMFMRDLMTPVSQKPLQLSCNTQTAIVLHNLFLVPTVSSQLKISACSRRSSLWHFKPDNIQGDDDNVAVHDCGHSFSFLRCIRQGQHSRILQNTLQEVNRSWRGMYWWGMYLSLIHISEPTRPP